MSAIKILTATFLIGKRNSCLFETVCETKESKEMKYYCVINNRDLISYGNKSRKLVEDYKEQFCDDTVKIIELQSKSGFDVVVKKTCEWKEDKDGVYFTECNNAFFFDSDGVAENKGKYCFYCGKVIKEIKFNEQVV